MKLTFPVPRAFVPLLKPFRYKGAYGGRGGAKSHFFAEQAIARCISKTQRVACIREVQDTIKSSVKQLLVDKINNFDLNDYFDVLDTEIRGKNGSQIIFKGMQSYNAANIKSLEGFDIAWIEEAQTLSQVSLDILRPTLRKPGSEIWASWNPVYKTDPIDVFFRKSPPNNAISVCVNWQDNPYFMDTPLYVDMLNDYKRDPDTARHVWGGDYGANRGAILSKWVYQAEKEGRISDDICYDPEGAPIVISSDLGFRDTCAWWYWQPCVGGVNLIYYDFDHGLDVDDWAPRIRKTLESLNIDKLDKVWLPHDGKVKTFQSKRSSQERMSEEFGWDKVDIVPSSSKSDRVEAARSFIKRCAFNKTLCEAGLDGLREWQFEYSESNGIFSKEPKHDYASHPSDAFSYGCQVLQEIIPKSARVIKPKFWNQQSLEELYNSIPTKHRRI